MVSPSIVSVSSLFLFLASFVFWSSHQHIAIAFQSSKLYVRPSSSSFLFGRSAPIFSSSSLSSSVGNNDDNALSESKLESKLKTETEPELAAETEPEVEVEPKAETGTEVETEPKAEKETEKEMKNSGNDGNANEELKKALITKISEFRELKVRDGNLVIDFGVKGGELNSTSRAPQKIDFYSISKDVGLKADEIIQLCTEKLSPISPTKEPTLYLGDQVNGNLAPLNGPWKSLFTTAADANFDKKQKTPAKNDSNSTTTTAAAEKKDKKTRGSAKVQNIVDATKGIITNVIDFDNNDDGTEPVLKQLKVIIRAIPVSAKRVELQFKYAKLLFTKFFFLKWKWSLYIPVPGPFITRCIVFVSRILKFWKKKDALKKVPKAYLDVLYLDDDLRIHRTGEDNLFVQARETWESAKPLLA